MRKSTLSPGSPDFWISSSGPGEGGAAVSMNMSFGSSRNDQTSRKAFLASRFFRTIWTGPAGAGKRSDSENVRRDSFASSVSSHSP